MDKQHQRVVELALDNKELRDALANYAHSSWSGWMQYVFGETSPNDEVCIIPRYRVERWRRQMNTDFHDLPADEQKSDYAEAEKIIQILLEYYCVASENASTQE